MEGKYKWFLRSRWRHQMETFSALLALCEGESTGGFPLTKASDAELWCFRWSEPEQMVEQTIETPMIWDAIAFIMTSLSWWKITGNDRKSGPHNGVIPDISLHSKTSNEPHIFVSHFKWYFVLICNTCEQFFYNVVEYVLRKFVQ